MQKKPLILTLKLDQESQAFFNVLRKRYFPPDRNFIDAHLTLFHQLPNDTATRNYLITVRQPVLDMQVTGLRNLGGGVAYRVDSKELQVLHRQLSFKFAHQLIPQDCQPFQPHIVIQNKVPADKARTLLTELTNQFNPFTIYATGLDLWTYFGGHWRHEQTYAFN